MNTCDVPQHLVQTWAGHDAWKLTHGLVSSVALCYRSLTSHNWPPCSDHLTGKRDGTLGRGSPAGWFWELQDSPRDKHPSGRTLYLSWGKKIQSLLVLTWQWTGIDMKTRFIMCTYQHHLILQVLRGFYVVANYLRQLINARNQRGDVRQPSYFLCVITDRQCWERTRNVVMLLNYKLKIIAISYNIRNIKTALFLLLCVVFSCTDLAQALPSCFPRQMNIWHYFDPSDWFSRYILDCSVLYYSPVSWIVSLSFKYCCRTNTVKSE